MAFLAGIVGMVGRFAGKILTTTLGWASMLLFGRVPADRQIVLALITFGSVVWAALAFGVVLPNVGAFLVAAVPAPELISESWLRLAMLAGALVVPAIVGAATIFVVEPARRPRGAAAIAAQVARGYPLCAALAVTLVLLALVGAARFLHHLALRWTDAHIPVVIRPGGYDRVVADLERALEDAGLDMTRRPAPAVLAVPGRLLGSIAGAGVRSLVPDRLVQLAGEGLEVGLYPSDIAISGDRARVARAQAAIGSRLVATAAWMTTSAEAQQIEDRLERLSRAGTPGGAPGGPDGGAPGPREDAHAELRAIDQALATLVVPHDEWEVLYRERLQVERDLLAGQRPGGTFPGQQAGAGAAAAVGAPRRAPENEPLPGWMSNAVAAAGLVLIATDVAIEIAIRRRR
jgi:hypothetical protein